MLLQLLKGLPICVLLAMASVGLNATELSNAEFESPPKSYLPKTWMHAMNGNMSKPGFSKDFEAMSDVGIGGAIFFHVHRSNWPYSSRGPVRFGSDEYFDTLVHAVGEADKHDIELGIHNSDGWSSSGGPWITPELSMKRVTWSEKTFRGGQKVVPPQPGYAEGLYRDIAVIAVPTNSFNQSNAFENATFSSSDKSLDVSLLTDKDWDTEFQFKKNANNEYWIQVELDTPTPLRSLQLETPDRHGDAALKVSDDGVTFSTVVEKLRRPRTGARMWAFSPNLDTITAKYFRFVFTKPITLKRFDLWTVPRIDHWLSMNSMERGQLSLAPQIDPQAIIKADEVLVLNRGELPQQGVTLAKGDWRVLRFGYTSTGAFNVPASAEGEGLECDKFDPKALRFHFKQYVGKVVDKMKEHGYDSLKTTEIDSYEMGGQNWTKGMDTSFKTKFGYDFVPWLPLLTGRVIESVEHTGAILQEYRQHLSDLMVTNYFGEFTKIANEYGLESYIEPYGWGPFDELKAGGMADRVMGEFWVRDTVYNGRVSAAISSAHIYGKKIISAESFTSIRTVNWKGHPFFYKHYGDKMWARGVNETMFHRFAHQPNTHVKPGMTMDSIGSHIDRTQTWWNNGGTAWFNYLARGSYLLQQGVPDSDFLIHLGDVAPLRVGNANNTGVPDGFGYDYTNTDVLLTRISVKDGWLVLPEGTRYRALHLTETQYMQLATLKRIEDLVAQGATVIGRKPKQVIGYSEWQHQGEFERIADRLWGEHTNTIQRYKKGTVSSFNLVDSIAELNYEPDLKIDGEPVKFFSHRRIGHNDLYYFYNGQPSYQQVEVDIRNGDGVPELWNIDDGTVELLAHFKRDGKRLKAILELEPYGGRFVLIRRDQNQPEYTGQNSHLINHIYRSTLAPSTPLEGPWLVSFDPKWGGPESRVFNSLIDWIDSPEEGVRHYSGTANYRKTFTISDDALSTKKSLYLDLGQVNHVAEVFVNGKAVQTLWKPPYATDIGDAIKPGENVLDIKITNTWVNRLIGDEALPDTSGYSMTGDTVPWINNNEPPPPTKRVTFTGYNFYVKQPKELQSSGLLGPVRLITSLVAQR
ncbi:glycosyl hydrolase [Echinimonas agarilytica]|uniref:Discoidin domain-containing protein n=1 Tax=Echinimonas agarilytica TaxID=1215918 RepID=A0AA42B874_9GAMM|nr:glycosyl hydrolase [Echinimonas agarilytica]MCM2680677.1 discoidin domain-containing protein [Echinimonas agarilytica]